MPCDARTSYKYARAWIRYALSSLRLDVVRGKWRYLDRVRAICFEYAPNDLCLDLVRTFAELLLSFSTDVRNDTFHFREPFGMIDVRTILRTAA